MNKNLKFRYIKLSFVFKNYFVVNVEVSWGVFVFEEKVIIGKERKELRFFRSLVKFFVSIIWGIDYCFYFV